MRLPQLKIWLHTQVRRAQNGQWVFTLNEPIKCSPGETKEVIRLLRETGAKINSI